MTDKELLEKAAKASGIEIEQKYVEPAKFRGLLLKSWREAFKPSFWNPLVDDGDALRLAVKLNMTIRIKSTKAIKSTIIGWHKTSALGEPHGSDPYSATRRAIVRAAAAIGETK